MSPAEAVAELRLLYRAAVARGARDEARGILWAAHEVLAFGEVGGISELKIGRYQRRAADAARFSAVT